MDTSLSMDEQQKAKAYRIIEGLGGVENIVAANNCLTRLRVDLVDPSKVREDLLKKTGASGFITHCSEDNKHAIGLRSDSGQEVLIHVGVDTVGLNGEGFEQIKAEGDKIKLGEPILRFSRKFIESKKLCSDVMVILIEDEDPVVAEYVTGVTAEAGKTTVAKIG